MPHSLPVAEARTSPQSLPTPLTNSASLVLTPPHNAEEEEADPLVSALSFTTAPGNKNGPLLSMHVSALIKKEFGLTNMLI